MTMKNDARKFTVWRTDATSLADATEKNPPSYYIDDSHNTSMEEHGWIKVGHFEQSFERPSLEAIMPAAVAAIEAQMTAINLKAAQETAALKAQISKLQALEFDGGEQ